MSGVDVAIHAIDKVAVFAMAHPVLFTGVAITAGVCYVVYKCSNNSNNNNNQNDRGVGERNGKIRNNKI